jgi:hypothetical protein
LLWFLVVPLLLAILDVAALVALGLIGLVAHTVLRRPWEVEAKSDDTRLVWLVGGWRQSNHLITEVEASLRAGREPPPPSKVGHRRSG